MLRLTRLTRRARAQSTLATALYDGSCPLCAREIAWMRTFSNARRVSFEDVSADAFDARAWAAAAGVAPVAREELLDSMHVLDARAGGAPVMRRRVPAFRALYAALVGRDVLAFTALPGVDRVADAAYEVARLHKHRLAFLFK
jgi:predicted DCC family thiol-disulfide oxidoreductase YuxK